MPPSEWQLVDLAGTPIVPGSKPTLAFPDVGRLAGDGFCNRFTGSVNVAGDILKMGALASTRMACLDNNISK
jgi:heat shock protein HslJ